jgi:outer membrane protein TolC
MTSIAMVALAFALAQGQVPQPEGAAGAAQAPPAAAQQAPPASPQQASPATPEQPGLIVSVDEERLYKMAGPMLTLDEALDRAQKENVDLRVARARLRQAETLSRQAWAGYLPQVSAGGTYTRNELEASISLPTGYWVRDSGTPQGPPSAPGDGQTTYVLEPSGFLTAVIQKQDQLGAQVQATQAIFVPELWAVIRNASRAAEAAGLNAESFRRTIVFLSAQVYYGVASLRQLVEVSERLLEMNRRQERDAQIRLKAGTIAKVGLVRAEIERARAEQDLRRARNSYLSAKIALAALLNRSDLAFEVVAEPPPLAVPDDLPRLQERALRERPDVRAAEVGVEFSRGQRNAILARYLPAVGAFGRYQWANIGGFTGKETTWAAGIAVQWNIFDGGLREAQLSQASARIDESEAALASARQAVATQVAQALLDWQSARANGLKAKEQRDLAAENQRLVDVSYRAGAATALEQADATTALRNAEIAYQTESLNAQIAGLRVIQAAGAADPRASPPPQR